MSSHVVGFRPKDDKWLKHEAVWRACEAANVPVPEETSAFFGDESPEDRPGLEVKIDAAVTPYRDDYRDGFDVDVSKLPKDVTVVRFYNSY